MTSGKEGGKSGSKGRGVRARAGDSGHNHPNPATPIVVSFQGERGAYSEKAILQFFGAAPGLEPKTCRQFEDVFLDVSLGRSQMGMIPVENALTGSIHENFDLLLKYTDLEICGEEKVRIQHCLIGTRDASLQTVRRVYSHPQGLMQCERFLDSHPAWERMPFYDTAGSVAHIVEQGDPASAAIAGILSAEIWGAKVLVEGIETNPMNFTRFFLIRRKAGAGSGAGGGAGGGAGAAYENGRANAASAAAAGAASSHSAANSNSAVAGPNADSAIAAGAANPNTANAKAAVPDGLADKSVDKTVDKASIVFSTADKPGALLEAMQTLAARGINLQKIESRPIHGRPWTYMFYLDLQVPADPALFTEALRELSAHSEDLRVLGLYKSAD